VVVVGANVLHYVKRRGDCTGRGNVGRGKGICPGGNVVFARVRVGRAGVKCEVVKCEVPVRGRL